MQGVALWPYGAVTVLRGVAIWPGLHVSVSDNSNVEPFSYFYLTYMNHRFPESLDQL